MLYAIQKGQCSYCKSDLNPNEIYLNSHAQIDHSPRIHLLKFYLWCKILKNFGIYDSSSGSDIESLSLKNLKFFVGKPFNPVEILY